MFRSLATAQGANGGNVVFAFHPMQLARYLEETWAHRPSTTRPDGLDIPGALIEQERRSGVEPDRTVPAVWDHLIYAYMIENTRAFEIFRRVVEEFTYGERLGTPQDATQRWLRTTEQLFYSNDAPYQIFTFTSWIRPDARATRRNAYFRMFGMDLNHGTDDNRPYPYPRSAASNTDFAPTWEELLREVWLASENFTNSAGARPTDDAAIANLARRLFDMLTVRRLGGNLNREELAFVSTMSWFHLTLSFDSPIVVDLEAQASSPEERLFKIGERVGLPAHSRSDAYFRLADNMSLILRTVELGQFNAPAAAQTLYMPSPPAASPVIQQAMLGIIRDWSISTGRDMKGGRVSVTPPQPVIVRPAPVQIAPPANGRASVSPENLPV
jgi:hypothetical protein